MTTIIITAGERKLRRRIKLYKNYGMVKADVRNVTKLDIRPIGKNVRI